MPIERDDFRFDNPRDPDNEFIAVRNKDGTVELSISDEKAVDSYNEVFTCDFEITAEQAARLGRWLLGTG